MISPSPEVRFGCPIDSRAYSREHGIHAQAALARRPIAKSSKE
jgi:hypothetical protein